MCIHCTSFFKLTRLCSIYSGRTGAPLPRTGGPLAGCADCAPRRLLLLPSSARGGSRVPVAAARGLRSWFADFRAQAGWLWARLSYSEQVVSSWTRDGDSVPCIARRVLNHWTSRETLSL